MRIYTNVRKKKKWAEARREEEEDFNLSPWFVIKPLPAVISFYSCHL
jgi:hypothetical protein